MTEAEKAANEELSREAAELTERLEAARQKRAEAAAMLEPSELEALRQRVAAEERAARNEAALAASVKKHGALGVHVAFEEAPDGRLVIIKRPHPAIFKAFQDLEKLTFEESEKLVRSCVDYPDKGAYDAIADEFPGIVTNLGVKACGLAGLRRTELRGK